jgi:hypothetical protein
MGGGVKAGSREQGTGNRRAGTRAVGEEVNE